MTGPFHAGEWFVEPDLNRVTRGGVAARLRPRVMDLLVCLAEHPGEVLSKQTLLDRVWGAEFVSESALTTAVTELRQAFRDTPEQPRMVETVAKRGYRLIAPVRSASTATSPVSMEPAAVRARTVRRWRALLPLGLLAGMLLVVVGVVVRPVRLDRSVIRSIAVLPFDDLSGDPARAWYGDSLTQALITELSAIDRFEKVINRADRYRGATRPLIDVARELDVDAVVTGTVMTAADRLIVHVRLVDGRTERPLWAAPFERVLGDVWILQREIVQEIARDLRLELPDRAHRSAHAGERIDPAAYEAYWRARASFNEFTPESRQLALQHIERAVLLAPGFAPAHAAMAEFYGEMILAGGMTDTEALARASAAALKALNLDPDLAEAHSANGRLLLLGAWDWAGAERAHKRAIALKRNSAPIRGAYGHYLTLAGRYDEALAEMRRAGELDPASFFPAGLLAWGYVHAREFEKSASQWERAFTFAPESKPTGRPLLARAYAKTPGREADALALCDEGRSMHLACAPVYAVLGRPELARSILHRLPDDVNLTRMETHALLGDLDDVLRLLERAAATRHPAVLFLNGPAFDRIRDAAGFQAFRVRLRYPSF